MPFVTPYGGSANPDNSSYEFLVTIKTESGDITVSHTETTSQIQGIYFYYPDPRAKHVVIKKNGSQILNVNLMEHPTLNGAYYFAGITPTMVEPSGATGTIPDVSSSNLERLPNYIITSEVNNPFVFKAKGYNKEEAEKMAQTIFDEYEACPAGLSIEARLDNIITKEAWENQYAASKVER